VGNTPPLRALVPLIDGFFASVTLHHELPTVILLRLLSLVGVAMIAYCIPKLARFYGRDPAGVRPRRAESLVIPPCGGAHNDAIMVGLLVRITAASSSTRLGVILCALAAAIKVPPGRGRLCRVDWLGTDCPAPAAATVGHRG